MKSRGGQVFRFIAIPYLPNPPVGGICRLCSGMFIPQEQEVQDSSLVKGQQGQFMLFLFFFFFINYLASLSLSCSMQASRCIMRDLPLWYPGSPVVVVPRLGSCGVRACPVTCGMRDLSSPTRNQTCIARQITDYWTTTKVPQFMLSRNRI